MKPTLSWFLLGVVALIAVTIRFYDLDRSAVRSDEINFLNFAQTRHTVTELWKNPPWMNQIPLAESVAVIWHWFRPGEPNERSVREPFALIGSLTVIGVSLWMTRRRGIAAGVLVGVWMALLPFNVYQSREAYYYVVVIAMAAGMTLNTVDLLVLLRSRKPPTIRAYIIWTVWAVLTCLTHMSTWVVAGICWLMLLAEGIAHLDVSQRRQHAIRMLSGAAVVSLFMVRWVWRAVLEMQKVSQSDGHLGGAFGWVGPRVIPFFTVGANAIGVALALSLLVFGIVIWVISLKKKRAERDQLYGAISLITIAGFSVAYAYIGFVGGGAAKISYFTSLLPIFLVWAAYTLDLVVVMLPKPFHTLLRCGLLIAMAGVLIQPAWMVTQLDGKPVPYKVIRSWLDQHLDPGSVAVVDRWYEPWNEMARYAPSNVVVTFTVPDEPYDNYVQLRWREVTKTAIEQGKVQAFIRLTRNHENREGLWTWPETYFARKVVIVNEAGLWSRVHGYAANEDFYAANTNRLVTEIFYDLREDVLARDVRAAKPVHVFYEQGLPYEKSGPMGLFRFQTQQFMDWRSMDRHGQLNVYNMTDSPLSVMMQISAVAPSGPKLVNAGTSEKFRFSAGQMQGWTLGPIALQPGDNRIELVDPLWEKVQNPLLISSIEVRTNSATP